MQEKHLGSRQLKRPDRWHYHYVKKWLLLAKMAAIIT